MWILPKQLHTSAYVPDTAALISDLAEQSQICEPSLLARSKHSLARTWSQKWKRDSWTRLLSGRILKPSHGQSFVTAWTSSLEVIPASHSQQQASDSDETTQDTSGLGSQMELFPCDPESAFSRTSRDTSALDSERSSANWKALVIKRRGEYSLRVKSAHLTNASESSSLQWPTARAMSGVSRKLGTGGRCLQEEAQRYGQAAQVSPSTDGSRQESWATPSCMDTLPARSAEALARAKLKGGCKNLREEVHQWATPNTMDYMECRSAEGVIKIATGARKGRSMPSNLREQVDPQTVDIYQKVKEESWATPRAGKTTDENPESWQKRADAGQVATMPLTAQVKCWPTPASSGVTGGPTGLAGGSGNREKLAKMLPEAEAKAMGCGKLNPRWVETLMGLPIGWTMPSCSSPLTIEPMNCDCLETESFPQLLPGLF